MSQTTLIEVRCPLTVVSKSNAKQYPCNHLCVRVEAGSRGEAFCPRCKLSFGFEVDGGSSHRYQSRAVAQTDYVVKQKVIAMPVAEG